MTSVVPVENLFRYPKDDARVAAFGAKLSRRPLGTMLNLIPRSLMKLSFSSTPALNYEPWSVLAEGLSEVHVQEYALGCLFLAWGAVRPHSNGPDLRL